MNIQERREIILDYIVEQSQNRDLLPQQKLRLIESLNAWICNYNSSLKDRNSDYRLVLAGITLDQSYCKEWSPNQAYLWSGNRIQEIENDFSQIPNALQEIQLKTQCLQG